MKKFLIASILLFSSNYVVGQWSKKNYVDDFGDNTEEFYLSANINNGRFSNSATSNSALAGYVIVEGKYLRFVLKEYGDYGNSSVKVSYGILKVKSPDDKIFVYRNVKSNISLSGDDAREVISLLLKYSSIKVSLSDGKYSSTYSFNVSGKGFTALYNKYYIVEKEEDLKSKVFDPIVYTDMSTFYKKSLDKYDKFIGFIGFGIENPTIIIDSVDNYYIVKDKDVLDSLKFYVKKNDVIFNNYQHFKGGGSSLGLR